MDGAMTKSPLGGEKNREKPDRSRQVGREAIDARRRPWRAAWPSPSKAPMCLTRSWWPPTLDGIPIERPEPTAVRAAKSLPRQRLCRRAGRSRSPQATATLLMCRARPDEPPKPKHRRGKARRWKVERTHSWLNRARRLLIRWEKKVANYFGFLHLQFAIIALRTAGVLG